MKVVPQDILKKHVDLGGHKHPPRGVERFSQDRMPPKTELLSIHICKESHELYQKPFEGSVKGKILHLGRESPVGPLPSIGNTGPQLSKLVL